MDFLPYFILILSILIFLGDGYMRVFKNYYNFQLDGRFALGYIVGFIIFSTRY